MACVREPWCRDRALQSEHSRGNWPCQLGSLRDCPAWASSAPALLRLPAGERWRRGTMTVFGHCFRAEEILRLIPHLLGWKGTYLGFTLLDNVWRTGNERKYILALGLIRLISTPLLLLTLLKHSVIFYGSCAKIGVLSSCDINVVIHGNRVLCSTLKNNFVFLRGSAVSNKPLMLFCLRRVYKIKMHWAVNHTDAEFQSSELFLSERLLQNIFFKKITIICHYNQEVYSFINISYL